MGIYKDNPWLGLESYQENQIIYGRNTEIEELSQCVLNNTETVLYGKSGIGKSSIINAGILAVVRGHGYLPIVVRLDHNNKHTYIKQLSDLIEDTLPVSDITLSKPVDEQLLWEYFHTRRFNTPDGERAKLLIIFDQFEEIFTLQSNAIAKNQFFKELCDVLNNVMPKSLVDQQDEEAAEPRAEAHKQESVSGFADMTDFFSILAASVDHTADKYIEDNDIHFVFTLREDFLSEFEYHTSKIPSLKQHRYALRPLNEEQAAEVILSPRPELVDEGVARLIIETVTNRTDFTLGDEPEIDVDAAVLSLFLSQIYDKRDTEDSPITIDLVKTFGKDIIKDFYEESIKGLSTSQVDFLEEELLTGEDRRDSLSKSDFKAGGFTEAELKRLIDDKKLLRQFHYEGDLRVEFIHDILCPVVKERRELRELQRQQEAERIQQEEEKRRIQEEAEQRQREVEEKAAREKAQMEAESIRVKRRNKHRLIALLSIIVSFVLAIGSYYYLFEIPYSESYGNFTTRNGWPVGLGEELTSSHDKEKCTIYYRLSRSGRLNRFMGKDRPFTKVEILNWRGVAAFNALVGTPVVRILDKELDDVKAAEFADLLSRVSYWLYTPDANGLISMKTAYDVNNEELYSETFSSSNNVDQASKYVLWGVFNDRNGNPLSICDNGTDRIRYTISDGYVSGCSFFTILLTPQPNTSGDYGYVYDVDSISANVVARCTTDKFGDKIDSTYIHYSEFEHGRYTLSDSCRVTYYNQHVISKSRHNTDTIHITADGFIDRMSVSISKSARLDVRYESHNNLLQKKLFKDGRLCYCADYCYSSKLDSIRVFDTRKEPGDYVEKYRYPQENVTERSFWSNGRKIMLNLGFDEIRCHSIITETVTKDNRRTVTKSFYNTDGKLTAEGNYAKSMIVTDVQLGAPLYEYYYNNENDVCRSEMFTYNSYGIRESRAVAGIDGTPVRCPNWDWNGFTYYIMKLIEVDYLDDGLVSIKGVDELGKEMFVMDGNDVFDFDEMPFNHVDVPSGKSIVRGVAINKISLHDVGALKKVPFIHLLTDKGSFYNSIVTKGSKSAKTKRLLDGDIITEINGTRVIDNYQPSESKINTLLNRLASAGGQITVIRFENGKPLTLSFSVRKGDIGAEHHVCPITDEMYKSLKQALSHE